MNKFLPMLFAALLPLQLIAQPEAKLKAQLLQQAAREPYRRIGSNLFDLTPRIRWNELRHQYIPTSHTVPLPEWEFIQGKVLQITPEGLLFHQYDHTDLFHKGEPATVFIRNYPPGREIVDGTRLAFYAQADGRHQYATVSGASKTIWAYDHGTIPTPEEIADLKHDAELKRTFAQTALDKANAEARRSAAIRRAQAFADSLAYYRPRAATNDAFAQFRLGELLATTGSNQLEAAQWYQRAATNGNATAADRLKELKP